MSYKTESKVIESSSRTDFEKKLDEATNGNFTVFGNLVVTQNHESDPQRFHYFQLVQKFTQNK